MLESRVIASPETLIWGGNLANLSLTQGQRSRKLLISASDCRAMSNDFRDLNMQLFVTYIVLFVTAVKARFSEFYFFHCGPYLYTIKFYFR